jgi:hypothetical protein
METVKEKLETIRKKRLERSSVKVVFFKPFLLCLRNDFYCLQWKVIWFLMYHFVTTGWWHAHSEQVFSCRDVQLSLLLTGTVVIQSLALLDKMLIGIFTARLFQKHLGYCSSLPNWSVVYDKPRLLIMHAHSSIIIVSVYLRVSVYLQESKRTYDIEYNKTIETILRVCVMPCHVWVIHISE